MGFFNEKRTGGPKWTAGDEEHEEALAQCGVSVEAAWRIPGRPVRWLVENIIPDEAVTVIAGEPGAGKTFFACQLAADAARVSQCRVVLATSGYEPPELLRWRLDQADADTRRVVLTTLTPPKGISDRRLAPTDEEISERMAVLYHTLLGAGDPTSGILPADAKEGSGFRVQGSAGEKEEGKRQTAEGLPRAAELLVIDDVDGWFGKPGQSLSAADLARTIGRLNELARSLRVAIVVLVRAQVSAEGRLTSRQLSRLSQSASVVWMVVRDREKAEGGRQKAEASVASGQLSVATDDGPRTTDSAYSQSARRWLLPVKNNLAPDVATFGRAFELLDGQIRWHGDDPAPSLAEATLPSAHNSDRRRLRHAAAVWLQEALAAGPLPSKELYRQGVENGFSQGTLKRAATELGLFPHKAGFKGGWQMCWTPPPVVRGPGTSARRAGAGFKIFGGDDEATRQGDTETRGRAIGQGDKETRGRAIGQGDKETRRQGEAVAALNSSCASSEKQADFAMTSCASSTECEEIGAASCASSTTTDGKSGGNATRPHPGPLPEGEGTSCASPKTRNGKSGGNAARPHPGPPPEGEAERKAEAGRQKIENPKSDDPCNIYAVIADALQEAC